MKFSHSFLSFHLYLSLVIYLPLLNCLITSTSDPSINSTITMQIGPKFSYNNDTKKANETLSLPSEPKCPKSCRCTIESGTPNSLKGYTVSCSRLGLTIIPPSSQSPVETVTFDLSDNDISQVKLFDHDYPNLTKLNLSINSISTIEPKAFESIPTLEVLDLSFNKLSSIQDMIFNNLNNVKKIDLSDNDISKIAANSFDGQQWLEILILRGNNLKSLPEDLFRNNERLRILDLSHNSMYSLPDTLFHFTPALTTIDLSENQFNSVPSDDLIGATKLENLDISANLMKKLDHESFSGLLSLKTLKINNLPQLTEIDDYTFSYLHNLQHLEIKYNPRLNQLSSSAFFGITFTPINLTQVDLYGNQLSRLTEHTLPICNISRVDLRDNQWKCDCHFAWIKSCKHDDPIHQQIKCTSPLQLASLEIGAINVDQFTCPAEANSFSREIRLFRLFVVLFGVLTLIFMGFMVIYYLHKAKVIRSFGHKYQRMGSIHYVKDQTTDIVPE
ncbi:tsukushi-A-like [Panonychus citri]|uniref:tsukushi-A-like n=1 Tax=Panonychus citri TaxID=50023 RepID=UPI002306E88E|nr:tsukushi-A-like [Panonychus citri]